MEWEQSARALIKAAFQEDFGKLGDLTTLTTVPKSQVSSVKIVSREKGVLSGIRLAKLVFQELDATIEWKQFSKDGDRIEAGSCIATLTGSLQTLLMGERTVLNFLSHLSGIASRTKQYVDLVEGTRAGIYDTRKTLPGYRWLQKAAVRDGGGENHRFGLYDAVMIKDNHVAAWKATHSSASLSRLVEETRTALQTSLKLHEKVPLIIEVDRLEQFREVIPGQPDIVLLDNMTPDLLRKAVEMRDRLSTNILLEASGGITLQTVRQVAESGIDRISIGALTHTIDPIDIGFDWSKNLL